jgi:beta-galactosidase
VVGYNYMDPGAEDFHNAHPDRPVIGTETVSAVCTRGIYVTDADKGYVSSYDPYTTTGRASAEGWWRFCDARPWLAGGFIWTGFDYRGEPSPNPWPNIGSQYGVIDMCGFPKDTFFYYRSWWTAQPVLHVFPHWNWPGMEGKLIAVWVHSNMDKVELLVNGQSLGTKEMKKDQHLAWNVPYAPGVIEARGYKDGKLAQTVRRETTGSAAALAAALDRAEIAADGEDVAMVAVEVRDAQNRLVPITDNTVTFKVTGAGKLIGVGNGDPTDHAPDKGSWRKAFSGMCMALIQSTKEGGTITVEATSPGLTPASVTIAAKAVKLRPQVAPWERKSPAGAGISGLWRPQEGAATQIFTIVQDGGKLNGTAEGVAGGWAGGADTSVPLTDGTIDGDQVSFKAGNMVFKGKVSGDRIELARTMIMTPRKSFPIPPSNGPKPDIGPAPDGTDPSFSPGRRPTGPMNIVLLRAQQ